MLQQEFEERTGFEPTATEYAVIEGMYYEFEGSKDEFCKDFKENGGVRKLLKEMAAQVDFMQELLDKYAAKEREMQEDHEREISDLKWQLEREQEWKPFENAHNVSQKDYETLEADSCTREMSDDEAADLIASEFGFDRSKIVIVHSVGKEEINRHRQVRRVDEIARKALYNATDWNYIRFNVRANGTMACEMHNGDLQMYWN